MNKSSNQSIKLMNMQLSKSNPHESVMTAFSTLHGLRFNFFSLFISSFLILPSSSFLFSTSSDHLKIPLFFFVCYLPISLSFYLCILLYLSLHLFLSSFFYPQSFIRSLYLCLYFPFPFLPFHSPFSFYRPSKIPSPLFSSPFLSYTFFFTFPSLFSLCSSPFVSPFPSLPPCCPLSASSISWDPTGIICNDHNSLVISVTLLSPHPPPFSLSTQPPPSSPLTTLHPLLLLLLPSLPFPSCCPLLHTDPPPSPHPRRPVRKQI